jgi:hypothetical protein
MPPTLSSGITRSANNRMQGEKKKEGRGKFLEMEDTTVQ